MSETAKWRVLLEGLCRQVSAAKLDYSEAREINFNWLTELGAEVERIEIGIRNRDESITYLSALAKRETERAEAAEARLATIIGAHQGPMESCAERIKAAEAALATAISKLQRVRDALKHQANSEGGLVAEVDECLRELVRR